MALAVESQTFCPVQQRKFVLISAILASALAFIDGSVVSIATPGHPGKPWCFVD